MTRTILSKKYGVDLVRFTHHTNNVVCASKNHWDGGCIMVVSNLVAKIVHCLSRIFTLLVLAWQFLPAIFQGS